MKIRVPHKELIHRTGDYLPAPFYLYLRHCVTFRRIAVPWRPRTFNEHILRLMLDTRDQRRRVFADKLTTRTYIEQRLGPDHLPRIYFQTDDPDAIDFSALPDKFVLKASHGSGMNQIVLDKSQLDVEAFKRRARQWIETDFGKRTREWVYRNPVPRLLAEELLETEPGKLAYDYKLFCFFGRVALIHVVLDRSLTDQFCRKHAFYDPSWKRLDMSWGAPQGADVIRPRVLSTMIHLASLLSREFDFLRVDMYLIGDRIVIGELTNFPDAGNCRILPVTMDYWLGSHFNTN